MDSENKIKILKNENWKLYFEPMEFAQHHRVFTTKFKKWLSKYNLNEKYTDRCHVWYTGEGGEVDSSRASFHTLGFSVTFIPGLSC